jgi:hydrogenase maturation protease
MQADVVVFAIGNASRGDDALGPLLLERLAHWLAAETRAQEFELIDDYQLQIEHALDLRGRRLALFIDAGCATPAPFSFYSIGCDSTAATSSTHALPPEGVLDVYRRFEGVEPPPSFVLCIRGEHFELGEELSDSAKAHAELSWAHLKRLCLAADADLWRDMADKFAPATA